MNWIHKSELRKYYNYDQEKNNYSGTFEEYTDKFLNRMSEIGLLHVIINDEKDD